MTVLYWGTEDETPIDKVCLKYGIRLIKSREKLKKIFKLIDPDLLFLNTDEIPERKIHKYIEIGSAEKTFLQPVSRKMSLSDAELFLKRIDPNSRVRIPITTIHPYTDALLIGYLISQKNNFEWIPENPYLLSSLPENTKLRRCTLNNGEKTFNADFEFYSDNGRYFLRSMIL